MIEFLSDHPAMMGAVEAIIVFGYLGYETWLFLKRRKHHHLDKYLPPKSDDCLTCRLHEYRKGRGHKEAPRPHACRRPKKG